jgi:hypothetical protein
LPDPQEVLQDLEQRVQEHNAESDELRYLIEDTAQETAELIDKFLGKESVHPTTERMIEEKKREEIRKRLLERRRREGDDPEAAGGEDERKAKEKEEEKSEGPRVEPLSRRKRSGTVVTGTIL